MKVSSTELPPRQVSLAIEVEQERLDRAIDDAFRRLAGRVDVPGFRRGKAPRRMVERLLGQDRIVEEALDRLLPDVVTEAMQQENVEAWTRPRVESIEFDPLRVKAVVGLAPRVELGDYKGQLSVSAAQTAVTNEQVEEVIERLRGSYAQWVPVERAVKLGDRVGIDLQATIEGSDRPLLDSKEAEYIVDPEGAQPAPGFAEQLVGLASGESKNFTLTMPDDHGDEHARGKPAQFEVLLHWVKERELPAVDDEFAQQVGEYTDVAGLRSAVEAQLQERERERARGELEEAAITRLVEISSIEFPPQLVDHQAQHMLESFQRNIEQQGLQLQQYLRLVGKDQESLEQEIRAEAESRVRRTLALDAFATAEQISVDPDEVANEFRQAGGDAGLSELAMSNPTNVQRMHDFTRERKAVGRLVELATRNGHSGGPAQTWTLEKPAEAAATADTEANTVGREEQERGAE